MPQVPKIAMPTALAAAALSTAVLAGGSDAGGVSFKADIAPVLASECAACHMMGTEPGEISLIPAKAYASLVDADSVEADFKRVKPGAPDESYLVMKLAGTHVENGGMGEQMPFGGAPLSDDTQARIRLWIAQGAPNN